MKRSDLAYITAALRQLKPDPRTAPVIQTTEWRRIVLALGHTFSRSPWRHLHDPDAYLAATDAATPEPSPTDPYESDGAWYNLTESEGLERGLVQDPSAPRWLVPRNRGPDGFPIVDVSVGQIIDAISGEWRDMTDAERAHYAVTVPAPGQITGVPAPVPPTDAWETNANARRGYCGALSPTDPDAGRAFSCTRPPGHSSVHEAVTGVGRRYCAPWATDHAARPARLTAAAVRAAAQATRRSCGDEYEDEEGDVHSCTEPRGHHDHSDHSDGDITW